MKMISRITLIINLLLVSSTCAFVVSSSGSATNTGHAGIADVQPTTLPKSDVMELHSSAVLGDTDYFQRKRTLTKPSVNWDKSTETRRDNQNASQKVGQVVAEQTKIQSLQEFRNFITADHELQRYTVVKFYASWCKTCAKFGLKHERLVAKHGDWMQKGEGNIQRHGSLRFASVEYNSNTLELFQDLGVQKLPTVQIYDANGDLVAQFDSPYTNFKELSDSVRDIAASRNSVSASTVQDEVKNIKQIEDKIQIESETTREAFQLSYAARSFDDEVSNANTSPAYQMPVKTKWWKRITFRRVASVGAL